MGTMSMGIIIPRSEAEEISRSKGWILVFGRRKTGKTFLLRKMVPHDYYFFVTRGGEIFDASGGEVKTLPYSIFLERLKQFLTEERTIVIDEFQRLPDEFLDFLHYIKPLSKAKLVLVGSSIQVSRKILSKRSPLLGIIKPIRIGLIKPVDMVLALSREVGPYKTLQLAPLLRDPWILEFVDYRKNIEEIVKQVVQAIRYSCKGLIGEVFLEEDRELTERYEAVLRAIADGYNTPGLVANYVSNVMRGVFKSHDVKKYISNLLEMGLVKRKRVYSKKRYLYQLDSPLLDLFYFLDVKFGFYEIDTPQDLLISKALNKIPLYYEEFIIELLAQILNAEIQKSLKPEIDGVLVKTGKPVAVVEVKYGKAYREDIYKFLAKTENFKCKKILVAKEAEEIKNVELLTPLKIIKQLGKSIEIEDELLVNVEER